MSYIITDGTSYCHRTKTRAVEIVPDVREATKFPSRQSAENLLARATKKLKGFQLVEISSQQTESAAGDPALETPKKDAPSKTGARKSRKAKAAKEVKEISEETKAAAAAVSEETPDTKQTEKVPENADATAPKEETHKTRRSRSGRRTGWPRSCRAG